MLYLTDALPKFCPNCGNAHSEVWKRANQDDFFAGASLACECGTKLQYLPTMQLLVAAQLNPDGDLHRYA